MLHRDAMAGKAPKAAWALPRFWVSIGSYKKQLVKNFGLRYWALPGSNSLWRPYCNKVFANKTLCSALCPQIQSRGKVHNFRGQLGNNPSLLKYKGLILFLRKCVGPFRFRRP